MDQLLEELDPFDEDVAYGAIQVHPKRGQSVTNIPDGNAPIAGWISHITISRVQA